MKVVLTSRFTNAYRSLPEVIRKKVAKTIRLLEANPRHPSLHLKKMQGVQGIWEARVDKACRITLEIHPDLYLLRNVGKHDETLGNP